MQQRLQKVPIDTDMRLKQGHLNKGVRGEGEPQVGGSKGMWFGGSQVGPKLADLGLGHCACHTRQPKAESTPSRLDLA